MKIRCLIFAYLIGFGQIIQAQNDSLKKTSNIIYLEVLGAGGYGSLNYERIIFSHKKKSISFRSGIGAYQLSDISNKFNPDFQIPMIISGYIGENHKIGLGAGKVLSTLIKFKFSDNNIERQFYLHSVFVIGYRYHNKKGGFVFGCNYTPIIEFNAYIRHWGGISLGYAF